MIWVWLLLAAGGVAAGVVIGSFLFTMYLLKQDWEQSF